MLLNQNHLLFFFFLMITVFSLFSFSTKFSSFSIQYPLKTALFQEYLSKMILFGELYSSISRQKILLSKKISQLSWITKDSFSPNVKKQHKQRFFSKRIFKLSELSQENYLLEGLSLSKNSSKSSRVKKLSLKIIFQTVKILF